MTEEERETVAPFKRSLTPSFFQGSQTMTIFFKFYRICFVLETLNEEGIEGKFGSHSKHIKAFSPIMSWCKKQCSLKNSKKGDETLHLLCQLSNKDVTCIPGEKKEIIYLISSRRAMDCRRFLEKPMN